MASPLAGVVALATGHPLVIAAGGVGAFALFKAMTSPAAVPTDASAATPATTPAPPPYSSDPNAYLPSNIPTGPQDFADIRSALEDALAQIGIVPAPVPVAFPDPAPTPTPPVTTPAPVSCGPMPLYVQPPGTVRVCRDGAWHDDPIAGWTPPITPLPIITPPPPIIPPPQPPVTTPAPARPWPAGTWAVYQVPATTLRDFGVSGGKIVTLRSVAVAGLKVPVAAPARYVTAQRFRLADGSVVEANVGFELVRVIGGATYSGGWSGHFLSTQAGRATITRV